MGNRIARWLLNRVNSRVSKDRDLKYQIVLDDGIGYVDLVDSSETHTEYPVSADYYSNLALYYRGYVNEIGVVEPEGDNPDQQRKEIGEHTEIDISGDQIERLDQVDEIELAATEDYKQHMTNHIFQQALEPVDPASLGGLGLNKYYIWAALILLAIMAFGVASGGFTQAAALIPLFVPKLIGEQ